jgi:DNA-binding MarR family transcriptional regulator
VSTTLDDASAALSLTMVRVMKLFQAMRHHAPRAHPGVDAGAYPVLFNLAAGPKRVSELAECVHSDISTVSRQASTLVGLGIAQKVTDPDDGRAQLITVTDDGRALVERIKEQRSRWFAAMLHDWDPQDVAAFTTYLDRFAGALEDSRARALTGAAGTPADTPADTPAGTPDTAATAVGGTPVSGTRVSGTGVSGTGTPVASPAADTTTQES